MIVLFVGVLIFCYVENTLANSFPSLLTTNATLAVVIDKEYLGDSYDKVKESIENNLANARKEYLKQGGLNVKYFSWSAINVKRDFTAILSVASCADTWKLYKSAVDEHILFLSILEANCPRLPSDLTITIPLVQNGEELPQILLDLKSTKSLDWKSVTILHDKSLGRDMVTRVVTSLSGYSKAAETTGMAVTFLRLSNFTNEIAQRRTVTNVLSHLPYKQLGSNFIVIVNFPYVKPIMEAAKNLKLANPYSKWLYIIGDIKKSRSDVTVFTSLISEGDNIAFVYNITTNSSKCTSGVECHCEELLKAFTINLENAVLEEISLSSQVSDEEWEAIRPTKMERRDFLLKGVKMHLSEFGACGNCTKWQLKAGDTWGTSFSQNHTQELLQVGYWRPTDGVSYTDELFPHVSHKFRGRILPLITYHNPPWQILAVNETGAVIQYRGLVFDIIKELSRRLNFSYTIHLTKMDSSFVNITTKEFNLEVTNTLPNEIIEMVRNKDVMFGACGLTVTTQRKTVINFTVPISVQTHTLLVARPRHLSRALLFISPFTTDTWLCLALAIITMGPILYFINRYSPAYQHNGRSVRGLENIHNCMWYMYGALLQQGGMYLPEVDSARLVVGTWWLVVLVVVTTYCGNLVAFLTFPKIDIPIRTIDDLIAHRDSVTWGIIRGTYLEDILRESDERRYQIIYDGLILHEEITPDIVSNILARTHVLIAWKTKIAFIMKKHFMETGTCEFAFGTEDFLDEQIAMIVSQDSPYLEMINEEITRLHQVGLIGKWLQEYLPKRDRCWKVSHVTEVNNHTVNIDDMQGCFFVLFLGFSLSFLLILCEKFYRRRKLKKMQTIVKPFIT